VLNWAVMGAGAAAVGAGDALAYDGAAQPLPAVPAAIRGQTIGWCRTGLCQHDHRYRRVARGIPHPVHLRQRHLDTLNDEWQRYRDHDNHVIRDGVLALVARVPANWRPARSRAACSAPSGMASTGTSSAA